MRSDGWVFRDCERRRGRFTGVTAGGAGLDAAGALFGVCPTETLRFFGVTGTLLGFCFGVEEALEGESSSSAAPFGGDMVLSWGNGRLEPGDQNAEVSMHSM